MPLWRSFGWFKLYALLRLRLRWFQVLTHLFLSFLLWLNSWRGHLRRSSSAFRPVVINCVFFFNVLISLIYCSSWFRLFSLFFFESSASCRLIGLWIFWVKIYVICSFNPSNFLLCFRSDWGIRLIVLAWSLRSALLLTTVLMERSLWVWAWKVATRWH